VNTVPGFAAPWLVPLCAGAALIGFAGWAFPRARAVERAGEWAGGFALAAATFSWVARWRLAGHLPLFGTYESSLSLAVAVLAAVAVLRWKTRRAARLWPVAAALAAALVGHGVRFDVTAFPLTISERSWVVDVHAVFAWAAFGVLAANAGLALWLLVSRRRGTERGAPPERWLPRTLTVGFALHSAMLASGSLYKFLLFGKVWTFDPIETLGLLAWLAYGTLLHLHLFAGWQGRRLASWCLGLFVVLLVSYRGIVYFPAWSTYHIFDMNLRMHVTGRQGAQEGP